MTEKEKAKAYDEAIERAKKYYGNRIAEEIFPELNEDKDEMIKTAILNHLKIMWGNCQDDICGVHVEDAIDWLEKQRKPKSYWKPTEEQYEALDYAYNRCPDTERGNYYEGVLETLIEDLHILGKQGETSPILSNSSNTGKINKKSADKIEQ